MRYPIVALLACCLGIASAAPVAAESRAELLAAVAPALEPLPVPEHTLPIGLRAYGLLPAQLVTVGSRVLFIADDREHGVELWATDGTAAGTGMVLDIVPGEGSSYPRFLGAVGGTLVFWATTPGGGRTLWSSDGTPGGTDEIATLTGHAPPVVEPPVDWFWWQSPAEPAVLGGELFFTTSPGTSPGEECHLWATDGGGARLVESRPDACGGPLVSGGRVYFANGGAWRSTDGVAASVPVEVPECVGGDAVLLGVEPFDGGLALSLRCQAVATVVLVAYGEAPRVVREQPGSLEIAADEAGLWMASRTSTHGFELWHAAPGEPAEQVLVRQGVVARMAVVLDGRLLLELIEVAESWPKLVAVQPDGTATMLVDQPVAIEPGQARRRGEELVFFSGILNHLEDGPYRWDLWTTGGTPETTRRVATFTAPRQGPDGHVRGEVGAQLALLGGDVVVAADDGGGQQLRALREEVVEPTACLPSPEVLCLGEGRFEARVRWRNPYVEPGDGFPVFGDAAVRTATADSGYFWFFRPGNLELLVKVLDGAGVNGHQWVFHGPMTTLEYWLQVTDAALDITRTYRRAPGSRCGGADVAAFPAGPPAAALADGPAGVAAPLTPPLTCNSSRDDQLCLGDGRYLVEVTFRDHRNAPGVDQAGRARLETDDSGAFWFFRPDNVEVLVKMLDGTPVNGHHWVFVGAMTDLAFDVLVFDTQASVGWTYEHPQGSLCGTADTMAF